MNKVRTLTNGVVKDLNSKTQFELHGKSYEGKFIDADDGDFICSEYEIGSGKIAIIELVVKTDCTSSLTPQLSTVIIAKLTNYVIEGDD